VVACAPVDPRHDLAAVAAHARRHLDASYDAIEVRGEVTVRMGDAAGIVRLALFDAGVDATRLAQLHVLADGGLDDTGSHRLIFQIVATCRAEDIARCGDELAQIIASAHVRRSPGPE